MPSKVMNSPLYGKLDLQVYSVADLALRLGCRTDTLHKAIQEGRLKAVSLTGLAAGQGRRSGQGGYRILRYEVLKWLSAGDPGVLDPATAEVPGAPCPRCGGELQPQGETPTWGKALVCVDCNLVVTDHADPAASEA